MSNPKQNTILLVEDDTILLVAQAKKIKQFGYKVISANTGEKALRLTVEINNISLILMDIDLGKGIDGAEAARRILSKRAIPIIFITSHSEKEYIDRVKEIIHYGYVIKNSGDFVLQSTIKMALELFETHGNMERKNQELIAANRKLCEKELEYTLLFETALAGVFIAQDDKLAIVNSAAAEIIGHTAGDLTSKPFTTFIHPDDVDMVVDRYTRRVNGETIETNYPFRIVTADERVKWVNITSTPTSWNGKVATLNYIIDITEQKRAEVAQREREKIHRLMTDNSVDMISRHAANGTILYVTPSCEQLTGYTAAELTGKSAEFLLLLEDCERVWDIIHSRQEGEDRYQVEHRMRVKDGSIIWVETMGKFIRDESGRVTEIQCNVRDITERKQNEEGLLIAYNRLKRFIDSNIIGVVTASMDGKVIEANDYYLDMIGFTREEFESGMVNWRAITPPEWLSADENGIRELRKKRTCTPYEKEYVKRDGTRVPVLLSDAILPGPDEQIVAFVLNFTERRRIEEELKMHRDHLNILVAERTAQIQEEIVRTKEREEQYLALVESIKEWVWETDTHFVHTYISPRIYDILGYMPDELMGRSPSDIMPPEEVKRAAPLIKKIFSQGKPFISFQNICFHKKGNLVFLEVNGRPFYDQEGNLLGYRGSCHDITEQKKTMDALREREKDLTVKSETLEEVNTALRVLLKQREEDKKELEGKFVSNVREMVLPYLSKIQKSQLDIKYKSYLDVVEMNLNEIISPFLNTVRCLNFTPKEGEVSSLIKDGRTTKEIAELLSVAPSAIDSHRNNIRMKLGLNNKKVNLRSYLLLLK